MPAVSVIVPVYNSERFLCRCVDSILGQTLQESVQHSMDTYGADDLVWYNAQGGKRPHAAAAYPLLFGDVGVRLIEPNAAPAPQKVQQAA